MGVGIMFIACVVTVVSMVTHPFTTAAVLAVLLVLRAAILRAIGHQYTCDITPRGAE